MVPADLLFDEIGRTSFHFLVNLSQVFADDAAGQQDCAAYEPDGHQQRGPSGKYVLAGIGEQGIDDGDEG